MSCGVCKKECVPLSERFIANEDIATLDFSDEAVRCGVQSHFACFEKESALGAARVAWEEALARGQTMSCPNSACRRRGIKDDACTHMTCTSCQTVWCYVCGLDTASDECDKAPDDGSGDDTMRAEYRHNREWQANERRCPMFLSEVHGVDTRSRV